MFLATTNQLCQEVAVFPFSGSCRSLFISSRSFSALRANERIYGTLLSRRSLVCAGASCLLLDKGLEARILAQFATYSLTLFSCCMVCHGELARMKPATRYLTLFYLAIAVGGALGSAVVSLVAPWVFSGFWEFPLFLWVSCLLALTVSGTRKGPADFGWRFSFGWNAGSRVACAGRVKFASLHPGTPACQSAGFRATERETLIWLGCVVLGLAGLSDLPFAASRSRSGPPVAECGERWVGAAVMASLLVFKLTSLQTMQCLCRGISLAC